MHFAVDGLRQLERQGELQGRVAAVGAHDCWIDSLVVVRKVDVGRWFVSLDVVCGAVGVFEGLEE